MYAKIPFNAGWTTAQVFSVINALLGGTTNPASLPAGVTGSATIDNTVPHGWTRTQSTASLIVADAPITGLSTKRKYVRLDQVANSIRMYVGTSNPSGSAINVGNLVVTNSCRLADTTVVLLSTAIVLHVSITPTRFITMMEKPATSSDALVSGVIDTVNTSQHYGETGQLVPVVILDNAISSSSIAREPVDFEFTTNPNMPTLTLPTAFATFQIAGVDKLPQIDIPFDGQRIANNTVSSAYVYNIAVTQNANSTEASVLQEVRAANKTWAGSLIENTINGKTYVSWLVNPGVNSVLLVPKE